MLSDIKKLNQPDRRLHLTPSSYYTNGERVRHSLGAPRNITSQLRCIRHAYSAT